VTSTAIARPQPLLRYRADLRTLLLLLVLNALYLVQWLHFANRWYEPL